MTNEIERLRNIYTTQYNPDPQDRNYIWNPLNPVSIYYCKVQYHAVAGSTDIHFLSLLHIP